VIIADFDEKTIREDLAKLDGGSWGWGSLPGWTLNIAALLHRAEAILAVSYIFIVHFFIGRLRPTSFPMNQAMFSGSVVLEEAEAEKPAWVERLKKEGKLEVAAARSACTDPVETRKSCPPATAKSVPHS
jgi:hypothetical protein